MKGSVSWNADHIGGREEGNMLDRHDFDIHFDFRNDSGGKDPDIGSLTLRSFINAVRENRLSGYRLVKRTYW